MNLLKSQLRLVNVNFPSPISIDSNILLCTREKKYSNIHEAWQKNPVLHVELKFRIYMTFYLWNVQIKVRHTKTGHGYAKPAWPKWVWWDKKIYSTKTWHGYVKPVWPKWVWWVKKIYSHYKDPSSLSPNARYEKHPPWKDQNDTSFQVFMAGIAQMTVFWVITPRSSHQNQIGPL